MKKILSYLLSSVVITCVIFYRDEALACIGLIVDALSVLDKDEWLKILPIPISVILALTVVNRNHNLAVAREDARLRKEKIEALYEASIEYYSSGMELLDRLQDKKNNEGVDLEFSEIEVDSIRFDLSLNKIEMLFGLYIQGGMFQIKDYQLTGISKANVFSGDYVYAFAKLSLTKSKLIDICRDLAADN